MNGAYLVTCPLVLCKIGRVGTGARRFRVRIGQSEYATRSVLGSCPVARVRARCAAYPARTTPTVGPVFPRTTPSAVQFTRPVGRPHRTRSQLRTLPCAAGWCTDNGLRSAASAPTDCSNGMVPTPSAPDHSGLTLRRLGATSGCDLTVGVREICGSSQSKSDCTVVAPCTVRLAPHVQQASKEGVIARAAATWRRVINSPLEAVTCFPNSFSRHRPFLGLSCTADCLGSLYGRALRSSTSQHLAA